jgi:hypothetical protein
VTGQVCDEQDDKTRILFLTDLLIVSRNGDQTSAAFRQPGPRQGRTNAHHNANDISSPGFLDRVVHSLKRQQGEGDLGPII